MARFARGNIRFNFADMQDKYKKYCQHVFDLQNQFLQCADVLSTDEGTDNEDSDNDDMANKLEKILGGDENNKSNNALKAKKVMEKEEEDRERMDLQKMVRGDSSNAKNGKFKNKSDPKLDLSDGRHLSGTGPRKLKIYRTVKSPEGGESTRVEIIQNPHVIEAYVRIRTYHDMDWIKVYAQMDEQYKEVRRTFYYVNL